MMIKHKMVGGSLEKPWIAVRRATKDLPCDVQADDCSKVIKKGELYEHHFHYRFNNYRVCEHCAIHYELFEQRRPLNFREIQEIWEKEHTWG